MQHIWIVGKTGVGKSTLLANAIIQDIAQGHGCALFDPHGDLADQVLTFVPPARRKDVVYFNPGDRQFPIGFNILERVPIDRRPLVASSVVDAFYHLWKSSWGPQLEQILYNAVAALLDVPDGTLLGVKYMLTSPAYRRRVVGHIQDPEIRSYWLKDFAEHMPEREQRERTLSTLNKIGQLIADPMLRNIVGQPRSAIDFQAIMDGQQIFIANLSQGELSACGAAISVRMRDNQGEKVF